MTYLDWMRLVGGSILLVYLAYALSVLFGPHRLR